ncbi:MAG: hypothetical protein MRZ90_00875, partial [Candidatus Gastranaerophilales bacterium]|nr:hypothetical protein [Candidatus Gastranaerophilales bacterium]
TVSQTKGVGKKLAQKIIIELKDKLVNYTSNDEIAIINNEAKVDLGEVSQVLVTLGYNKDEINKAYDQLLKNSQKHTEDTNELLKEILNYLSQEGR